MDRATFGLFTNQVHPNVAWNGLWCDVEGVAVMHCGWTPLRMATLDDDPITNMTNTEYRSNILCGRRGGDL